MMRPNTLYLSLYTLSLCLLSNTVSSNDKLPSLKELSETKITSVSKKTESQFRASSSVSVITHEDIRRSGATSIAEAIRNVPGINVAQIDANKWAISARGFNRQYSNKLLVLIDGKTVYTPVFSGVFWDSLDTILADIDRIEVIRGPGATLWGSNAVNGVINIITKTAQSTQGTYFSALYGNQEDGSVEARYGGQLNNDAFYRLYAKTIAKDELTNRLDQTGNDDDWKQHRMGFRIDSSKTSDVKWQLHGEAYTSDINQTQGFPGLNVPVQVTNIDGQEITNGYSLVAHIENSDKTTNRQFSSYVDYYDREMDNLLKLKVLMFDLNYQQLHKINSHNELMWGVGYRYTQDSLESVILSNNQSYLDYFPDEISGAIYSSFIQNEFKIIPDELHMTLGAKVEHHYFTGYEFQPNIRLAYYPNVNHTIWAAISRASRTPTRAEKTISFIANSTAGGFVRVNGNRDYKSETLTAYELGHRFKVSQKMSLDTSLFYNEYKNLRTLENTGNGFPSSNTIANIEISNLGFGETYGFNVEGRYTPTKDWTITANYSLIKFNLDTDKDSKDTSLAAEEFSSPEQQVSILSRVNLTNNLELDTNLSFTDQLDAFDIDEHVRLDARIGWKPYENISLSLVGQNLLDSSHQEFNQFLYWTEAEIDRSIYAKLELNF